jgi:hypothetical protein
MPNLIMVIDGNDGNDDDGDDGTLCLHAYHYHFTFLIMGYF